MSNRIFRWFGGVAALAAMIGGFMLLDARNAALLPPQGYVDSGGKFGVVIGEPERVALARVSHLTGVSLYQKSEGGLCVFRRYETSDHVVMFADDSWRKGTICVVSRGGMVREVVWSFWFISAAP